MDGKIVIAVDFGTTYSAIGYAHVNNGTKPEDVMLEVIDRGWPGQGRRRSPKIPSVFKNTQEGFKYGFQVQNDPDRVRFAKLFLDPDQLEQARHLARFSVAADSHSSDALAEGVTAYLRALRERTYQHIAQDVRWERNFINNTPKEYVLSVPAIWSDLAKDRTLRCAFDAGFGVRGDTSSIRLVTEPEAAAVYTITTVPNCALQVNDVFVVCDAGGGTVDLATYRITAFEPALQIDEAAVGNGDLCGSVMLNKRFLEFVERKVGGPLSSEYMQEVEKEFNDVIKPSFTGDDALHAVDVDPDVPDNSAEGLENGRLAVTGEDLKEVFDPVVDKVNLLLAEQIEAVGNGQNGRKIPVLLVGGFGSSEYLKARVAQMFDNCDILQPPDAWSAVVRGALLRSMIKKRKIRGAYGVMFQQQWDRRHERGKFAQYIGNDRDKYRVWDRFEGNWKCKDRMEWYVKKGDEFSNTKVVFFPFYRNVGIHHSLKFEINLWAYLEGREGDVGPPFKDIDCRRIAVLRPDLSDIPKESFERRQSPDGDPYYRIQYTLEMSFDTVVSFRLRYDGVLKGDVDIEYLDPTDDGGLRGTAD